MLRVVIAGALAAILLDAPAQAQTDYPNRIVKIVVPYRRQRA